MTLASSIELHIHIVMPLHFSLYLCNVLVNYTLVGSVLLHFYALGAQLLLKSHNLWVHFKGETTKFCASNFEGLA